MNLGNLVEICIFLIYLNSLLLFIHSILYLEHIMKVYSDRACFSINCSIFVVRKRHSHAEIKEEKHYVCINILRSKKEFVQFRTNFLRNLLTHLILGN